MTAASYASLPRITIMVAVRNAASTMARALDSLAAQHYPKLEVLVWDCLSDDGTTEILARYSELIDTLIREQDQGPPDAYNRLLLLATGDFVGYLNADDEFEPGMLWAVAEAILHNPQADVISTGILCRATNRRGRRTVIGYYAGEEQLAISLENCLSSLPTFMLSRFVRREFSLQAGPYNTDKNLWYVSNDREWMTRLALMPCRNVVVPHALYGFDWHAKSLSGNPRTYTRIIEEHLLIAQHLLARTDLNDNQREIIKRWQKRQFAFGLWKSVAQLKFDEARSFLRRGTAYCGGMFLPAACGTLLLKMLLMLAHRFSGGIDRGYSD